MRPALLLVLLSSALVGCGVALPAPSALDLADCSVAQQRYDWFSPDVVLSVSAASCRSPDGEVLDQDAAEGLLASEAWRHATVRVDTVMATVGPCPHGAGPRTLTLTADQAEEVWGSSPGAENDDAQRRARLISGVMYVGLWGLAIVSFVGFWIFVVAVMRRSGVVILVWSRR